MTACLRTQSVRDQEDPPNLGAVLVAAADSLLGLDPRDHIVQAAVRELEIVNALYWTGSAPHFQVRIAGARATMPSGTVYRMSQSSFDEWKTKCQTLLTSVSDKTEASVTEWCTKAGFTLITIPTEHGIIGQCLFEAASPTLVSDQSNWQQWKSEAAQLRNHCVDLLTYLGRNHPVPPSMSEFASTLGQAANDADGNTAMDEEQWNEWLTVQRRASTYADSLMVEALAELIQVKQQGIHIYLAPGCELFMELTQSETRVGWKGEAKAKWLATMPEVTPPMRDRDTVLYLSGNHYARLVAQTRTRGADDPA